MSNRLLHYYIITTLITFLNTNRHRGDRVSRRKKGDLNCVVYKFNKNKLNKPSISMCRANFILSVRLRKFNNRKIIKDAFLLCTYVVILK